MLASSWVIAVLPVTFIMVTLKTSPETSDILPCHMK